MKARQIGRDPMGWLVVLDPGDEIVQCLTDFGRQAELGGAFLTGIGAIERGEIGWFDPDARDYRRTDVDAQHEVVSLSGNLARDDGSDVKLHAHVVLAGPDGRTLAGHLFSARVRPTLEIVVTAAEGVIERLPDEATGLDLIDLDFAGFAPERMPTTAGGPDGQDRR